MRHETVLNGYILEGPLTNAGGGMSQWAFAHRDGNDYFLKVFLSPKFPLATGPGTPAAKARKRNVCYQFERRHIEIARRLDPSKPGAGNLVVPCDFFRANSTYVKVMPRVRATVLPDASALTPKQVLVLLRSLAFSLRMLHEQSVVHADIKPDNVLVEAAGDGLYVAKLIDFDEAYVVGDPPEPEHIVGDPVYYSPELLRYIKRDLRLPPEALTTASDMFSLGLLLFRFLTGELPKFDRASVNYPAEALLAGGTLDTSAAPDTLRPVITRMLAVTPTRRPSVDELVEVLSGMDPATFRLETTAGSPTADAGSTLLPAGPMPTGTASVEAASFATSPPESSERAWDLGGGLPGQRLSPRLNYAVDIAFVIDTTTSMETLIDRVKAGTRTFHDRLRAVMAEKGRNVASLRVRLITYNNLDDGSDSSITTTPFFRLPEENERFDLALAQVETTGVATGATMGLDALSVAMASPWERGMDRRRHWVVMVTNSAAHPLEGRSPRRPNGHVMPSSLDALTDQWDDPQGQQLEFTAKRLLLHAPDLYPWSQISSSWDNVLHYMSGFDHDNGEIRFGQIIDAIAGSI